ncbi:hypothetical protein [Kineococcus glutinatus]|uniref:Glycosyl transferase family 2 n=1 Tax=Kineococcus glutinatus TaxID=1070872 RepID=A0ABP9HWF6_9ACTN
MRLHAIYRSHGGENVKGRPGWYGKQRALLSFCRAVAQARRSVDVDVVFLNDGPIPAERLDVMRAWGTPLPFTGGSNRRSYLRALALPRQRDWAGEDLVLLAEDDYLWTPAALTALLAASRTTTADYFAPYSPAPGGAAGTAPDTTLGTAPGAGVAAPGEVRWVPLESTTSTFAARVGALRQDERLLLLCCLSGGDFDHTSCLTLQGVARFGPRDLLRHKPLPPGTGTARTLARNAYLTAMKLAVDVRAQRRPSRRRTLLAASPAVATHMESGWVAPGDWAALARETDEWARTSAAGGEG